MTRTPRDGRSRGPSIFSEKVLRTHLSIQLTNAVAVWIHVVSVQWVLTERGESASIISLAPAALAVPFLVLSLPVGVIAGYASRKRMMALATTISSLAAVAAFVLTVTGADSVIPMVLSVMLVGLALVVVGVSWQSLLPETVDRRVIPTAALVDGAVFNLARSVGPLIAGVGLGIAGAEWTFALVAVLSIGCSASMWVSERRAPDRKRARRAILPELSGVLRFVASSAWTTRLLCQLFLFGIPSSALWALISLAVHDRLEMGSSGFGVMMALIGAGAVIAAVVSGGLRRRLRVNVFAAFGAGVFALALVVLAISTSAVLVAIAMLFVGAAWVSVQSTWMTMGHQFFPEWIRPRLIAFILLMFQGTQAFGSLLWGAASDLLGLQTALLVAASVMACSAISLVVVGLGAQSGIEPVLVSDIAGEHGDSIASDGPVEVRYEYLVDQERRHEFIAAMRALRRSRLRLGSRHWSLEASVSRSGLYVETYRVGSRVEYDEQERDRLTIPETELRRAVARRVRSVSGPSIVPVGSVNSVGRRTAEGKRGEIPSENT